jgi:hypothetical protein
MDSADAYDSTGYSALPLIDPLMAQAGWSAAPTIPAWISNLRAHLDLNSADLNHGPIAKHFEHLAHETAARARTILVEADQVADALGLDVRLLDTLSAGLGLS